MDVLALVAAVALVGLNAFFVATEFAIVKVRPTRIEELAKKGRPGATSVRRIIANIDAYLSAVQLGVTMTSLGLGWVGEPAFARLLAAPLAAVGVVDEQWLHRIALAGAFGMITMLHIVLGELTPKAIALVRPEAVAFTLAYPMRVFYVLCFPAIYALNAAAGVVRRLIGIEAMTTREHHSEDEIKIILSQARSAGLLQPSRAELLSKAMTLPQKTARHLMVPRNDVVLLDANLSWEENLERAMASAHTRFPLCDRELDDVIGVVDLRRALFLARRGVDVDLRAIATPATYFPEMMSAERLVVELRARRVSMAIIVDEYGGASGILTSADIVAAIMGEFGEDNETDVVPLPGGAFEVDGVATLEEVAEALRVALHSESMHTVAGYLMERLGRMPRQGDRVIEQGYSFNVVEVSGPRIQKVRIQREGADGRHAAAAPVQRAAEPPKVADPRG